MGIAASAGGLDAFKEFFKAMPVDSGMAFVLVPHLDSKHKSLMAELLSRETSMPVVEVVDGMKVEANSVYIIAPNHDLAIEHGILRLRDLHSNSGYKTAIDFFLHSLAEDQGDLAKGIVLSGTSSHGTQGIREIKRCGGMTMTQAPESAEFDQMPRNAIESGMVDFVLTPSQMPEQLIQFVNRPRKLIAPTEESHAQLQSILRILSLHTSNNFQSYRTNMLIRRIERRMRLAKVDDLPTYISLLESKPDEILLLCKDFLIGVTSFFREPEAFDELARSQLPELVAKQSGEFPVRVWVPCCATGEEAYSLAMLLIEAFENANKPAAIQIFATDINEKSIEAARRGRFSSGIVNELTPERLKRFFVPSEDDHYQVNKELRDVIVFSKQNILSDAPFSKLDLVSCRNYLIYLEPSMQHRLISIFHFAIAENGFLFLGLSETIGRAISMFQPVSKKWRIYQRLGTSLQESTKVPFMSLTGNKRSIPLEHSMPTPKKTYKERTEMIILSEYSPAAVLINTHHEILYMNGPLVNYLEFPTGELTKDLLSMARSGLRAKIREACLKSIQDNAQVVDDEARVKRNGHYIPCRLTVRPFIDTKETEKLLLVIFQDLNDLPNKLAPSVLPTTTPPPETISETLVQHLEIELKTTTEELQNTIEEMESSNEELQSSNEELESAKEELQALNEELNTVNCQLQEKVWELDKSNNDLSNLMASTEIATIFLDDDLRILRFTPPILSLFHIEYADEGRSLQDIRSKLVDVALLEECKRVITSKASRESEVTSEDGRVYLRRILPSHVLDGRIEGLGITYFDLTLRKQAEAAQLEQDARFRKIFEHAATGIAITNLDGYFEQCNPAYCELLGYLEGELRTMQIHALLHPEDLVRYVENLECLKTGKVSSFELENRYLRKDGTILWVRTFGSVLQDELGNTRHLVALVTDVTERIKSVQQLLESKQLLQLVMDTVPHYIYAKNKKGEWLFVNEFSAKQNGFSSPAEMMKTPSTLDADELEVLDSGVPRLIAEESLGSPTGETHIVQTSKLRFNLSGSNEPALLGVSVDITERKNAERKVKEGAERIRAILNTASDAIITINNQGVIDTVNQATETMFGYDAKELIGQSVAMLMPNPFREEHSGYLRKFLSTGKSSIIGVGREIVCLRKDGKTFPADLSVSQVDHMGLFTGVLRDISTRKELQKHILEIAANEQRRIGLELHDGTQQELTALSLYANSLSETLKSIPPSSDADGANGTEQRTIAKTTFDRILEHTSLIVKRLSEANQHVRDLAHGIMPVQIDAEGLRSALAELANSINTSENIECKFNWSGDISIPSNTAATHLYRIAQEAVGNSLRHACASRIEISLSQNGDRLTLEIDDNGKGLSTSTATTKNELAGMGLRTMEYRAGMIGGVMQLETNANGGTLVRCNVIWGGLS